MQFTGDLRQERKRQVNLGGLALPQSSRVDLLLTSRNEREQRELERRRWKCAVRIQSCVRSHRARRHIKEMLRAELDPALKQYVVSMRGSGRHSNEEIAELVKKLSFIYDPFKDRARLLLVVIAMFQNIASLPHDYTFLTYSEDIYMTEHRVKSLCVASLDVVGPQLPTAHLRSVLLLLMQCTLPSNWIKSGENDGKGYDAARKVGISVSRTGYFQGIRKIILHQLVLPASPIQSKLDPKVQEVVELSISVATRLVYLAQSDAASEFIVQVLSIPLLLPRLERFGLDSVYLLVQHHELCKICLALLHDDEALLENPLLKQMSDAFTQDTYPAYPNIGWLLGNLLDLHKRLIGQSSYQDLHMTLVRSIGKVLASCPRSVISPTAESSCDDCISDSDDEEASMSSNSHHFVSTLEELHPELAKQIQLLMTRPFLDSLCSYVASNCGDLDKVTAAAVIVDLLLTHFPQCKHQVLNVLAFSTSTVNDLWHALKSSSIAEVVSHDWESSQRYVLPLLLFASIYDFILFVVDDEDFYVRGNPFSIEETISIVLLFKALLFRMYWSPGPDREGDVRSNEEGHIARLRLSAANVMKKLRDRQSRKKFCNDFDWLMKEFNLDSLEATSLISGSPEVEPAVPDRVGISGVDSAASAINDNRMLILREIPFVIPFDQRVILFYKLIKLDKQCIVRSNVDWFDRGRGTRVRIRRDQVLADGYSGIAALGSRLKGLIQVQFTDQFGMEEAGIDGGGLFKEFLAELTKQAFDPMRGLFIESEHHYLYPNPSSGVAIDNHLSYFRFLGLILGKSLYEGILLEQEFANYFLRKLLGEYNSVDDLRSLDPELYRHLLFLKRYSGDFESLGLTFSVTKDDVGQNESVPLIPNGEQVMVTRLNRHRFIHLMADYKLNRAIHSQANAFLSGLREIVPRQWLRMFSADELQALISGARRDWSVSDLKNHTHYTNGYDENSPQVIWFWEVTEEMTARDRAALLRFCTSCSRTPLLGFGAFNPSFAIQKCDGSEAPLPTSSTCVNLLRLPEFETKKILREKLLYAIRSGAGFDLS